MLKSSACNSETGPGDRKNIVNNCIDKIVIGKVGIFYQLSKLGGDLHALIHMWLGECGLCPKV
ncbi:hypothetical protein RchiOBHm_Chr4g0414031 [Rosa chinensis]|uniref:Uncharacterized protein n=1 Tax=Rosa chinensis TaxID=74649 RepID=A0A2P6QW71_ROSCH|nr:hypothetical protein RchiOBHm_Chr4g0414031 [Rosa chinensis]